MPTSGAYEFKLATASVNGVVADENSIQSGEWAWHDRGADEEPKRRYILLICDPDCKLPATLWFPNVKNNHTIDAQGNVTPSVWHKMTDGDPPVERCGFHTQPTKLLGFVDLR
jgi:hypothetical protein